MVETHKIMSDVETGQGLTVHWLFQYKGEGLSNKADRS